MGRGERVATGVTKHLQSKDREEKVGKVEGSQPQGPNPHPLVLLNGDAGVPPVGRWAPS